jgi:hypothetical protein
MRVQGNDWNFQQFSAIPNAMKALASSMHWGISLQKILLFMTIVPTIRDICYLGLCKLNDNTEQESGEEYGRLALG